MSCQAIIGKTLFALCIGPNIAKSPPNNGILMFDEASTIFRADSKLSSHVDFSTTLCIAQPVGSPCSSLMTGIAAIDAHYYPQEP